MREHEVDPVRVKILARGLPGRLAVHEAEVPDLGAQGGELLLNKFAVVREPLLETRELLPVGLQAHGVQADAGLFRCDTHLEEPD